MQISGPFEVGSVNTKGNPPYVNIMSFIGTRAPLNIPEMTWIEPPGSV
jgi:hypothetical protein